MRRAFVETLCELASTDPRIVLLTGDLGFLALEPFRDRFPERFFNAGVAEQNMVGVATGLAEAGYVPYVYSIATFASLRPLEFIRNGPVMHRLPVRVIGMGAGFDYGHAGPTHYAVEDVAVMRTLPGMRVVVPYDSPSAAHLLRATAAIPGPVYYSLSKRDTVLAAGHSSDALQVLREGRDTLLVALGTMVEEALAAAERIGNAAVAAVTTFNPDPEEEMTQLLDNFATVITAEAQAVSGGLGAFVAGVIARNGLHCRFRTLAVTEPHDGLSGSETERRRSCGIDADAIVAAAQ